MIVIQLIADFLFHSLCGRLGHFVVKAVTFGKVEIEWEISSESILAEYIGAGILLGAAVLISMLA
ncbi:MAG: hypothetical protein NWQ35_00915 [Verrucomicrobiales bacterium]|jgi:hypothetical protein|nr:hypothetical protein [Verrucomicrobiales bacterium]MDP5004393.1 hypothetical protein [Verrucomicrobiales bacterium]